MEWRDDGDDNGEHKPSTAGFVVERFAHDLWGVLSVSFLGQALSTASILGPNLMSSKSAGRDTRMDWHGAACEVHIEAIPVCRINNLELNLNMLPKETR